MNIILPKIQFDKKFVANELTDSYKLVFDAPVEDYYGDEFPCQIYELEPHTKTIHVKNYYAVKNSDQFFSLAFPYLQFTIYKKTLYATISRTSFVSPDYCGLHDIVFNHFLYGYVCLPYEHIHTFDGPYGLINKFYSLSNRIGETQFNSFDRLKSWQKESSNPHSVLFSTSVLWKEKAFSFNEMIISSYDKPHQTGPEYKMFYKRPLWHDNHFTDYRPLYPYQTNLPLREKLLLQKKQNQSIKEEIDNLPVPKKKRTRKNENKN